MQSPHTPAKTMAWPAHRASQGITLVELLVTLSIVAILATMAAPSFSALIAGQQAKSAASKLYASLSRARSEAMMRNARVQLVPRDGDWNKGWQIIDTRFPTSALESNDATGGMAFTGPAQIVYLSSGNVDAAAAGSFLVRSTVHASASHCIAVEAGGRAYMKAGATC